MNLIDKIIKKNGLFELKDGETINETKNEKPKPISKYNNKGQLVEYKEDDYINSYKYDNEDRMIYRSCNTIEYLKFEEWNEYTEDGKTKRYLCFQDGFWSINKDVVKNNKNPIYQMTNLYKKGR